MLCEDLFPYLDAHVAGVTDEALLAAASSAFMRFFRDSKCWRENHDPISIVGGKFKYEIEVPKETSLLGISEFYVQGHEVTATAKGTFANALLCKGQPVYFDRSGKDIRIAPVPNTSVQRGLTFTMILMPTRGAQEVKGHGAVMAEKYADCIEAAALSYLLKMPAKTWTNGRAAAEQEALYAIGVAEAKREGEGYNEERVMQTEFNPDY